MRFIVTQELGRLCRWLRILGFDVVYYKDNNLGGVIVLALLEKRVILTRSQNHIFPEKTTVVIKSDNFFGQLREVFDKKNLKIEENKLFSRCTACNHILRPVSKEKVEKEVPKRVYKADIQFTKCPSCGKVYWPGSHWGKIRKIVKLLNC